MVGAPASANATVACVAANNARICGSTASTSDPGDSRSYLGGTSEANADLTVFRATPNCRAIALIASPSDL